MENLVETVYKPVYIHLSFPQTFLIFAIDKQGFQCYYDQEITGKEEVHMLFLDKKRNMGGGLAPFGIAR